MPPFVLLVFHFIYVAKQNIKISTLEYLRGGSKCTISRLNNQKFSGEGHSPLPRPIPRRGGDTPSSHPTPLGAFGASPPRRLDTPPPKLKSCLRHWGWATGRHQFLITLLLVSEKWMRTSTRPSLGGCARLSLTWGLGCPDGVGWVGPGLRRRPCWSPGSCAG